MRKGRIPQSYISTGEAATALREEGCLYSREYIMQLLHHAAENNQIPHRERAGQRRVHYYVTLGASRRFLRKHQRKIHGREDER